VVVGADFGVQGTQGEKGFGVNTQMPLISKAAKVMEVCFPRALFRNSTRLRVWRWWSRSLSKRQRGGKNAFIWNRSLEHFREVKL
jgi:hypothetical protein